MYASANQSLQFTSMAVWTHIMYVVKGLKEFTKI